MRSEAEHPPEARLFLRTVEQFNPRRGSLKGHVIAFAVGMILAGVVVLIERGAMS